MYALVVRFDIRDAASAEKFDVLTEEAVRMVHEREPGTLVYATHGVEDEPLARVFYEVYRDIEAFRAHETAEHVKDFHRRKDPFVVSHRVEFLAPSHAKGLPA